MGIILNYDYIMKCDNWSSKTIVQNIDSFEEISA